MEQHREKHPENELRELMLSRHDFIGVHYCVSGKNSRNAELSKFLNCQIDIKDLKGKRVLDAGCGAGGFLSYLQEIGADAYGTDFDKEQVRFSFAENVLVSDVQSLPFKGEVFDLLINFDVIEHVKNQPAVIENMLSKLKINGTLVLLTNNRLLPFDSDTKLFFINYLPKTLADRYLRFVRKRADIEYDVKTPTYFSFSKLCYKKKGYEVKVKGVFTVFGFYSEKFQKLKKLMEIAENMSYRYKSLTWLQIFAPKLALVVKKR
jgi:2-polyprenyl-3-methyl-5-hydroxy-6-metoxy-1,4-benzoquinol methylase